MEKKVSTIKKVELKKEDMHTMIMLEKNLADSHLTFLENAFEIQKASLDAFVSKYKNIGIIFRLKPIQNELSKDWERFIFRVIGKPNELDKFNNIFVNSIYTKLLLITNKRLLKLDLERVNEKIEGINFLIESYDERIEAETKEFERTEEETSRGFFAKLIEAWKK